MRCSQRIGRIHDAAAARAAVEAALASGATKVNAGPHVRASRADRRARCPTTCARPSVSGSTHVSFYQLTLEPNTAFFRNPPRLPDSDEAWAMQQRGMEALAAAGIERYEVSAFARPGAACAPQRELLAVRRLSGDRRRRSRQDHLRRRRSGDPQREATSPSQLPGCGPGGRGGPAPRGRSGRRTCPSSSCSTRCASPRA